MDTVPRTHASWQICGDELLLCLPQGEILFALRSLTPTKAVYSFRRPGNFVDTICTFAAGGNAGSNMILAFQNWGLLAAYKELCLLTHALTTCLQGRRHHRPVLFYDSAVFFMELTRDTLVLCNWQSSSLSFNRNVVSACLEPRSNVCHVYPYHAHLCETLWTALSAGMDEKSLPQPLGAHCVGS